MQKIGHRGAKGYVAENTIASIEKAIQLGVDAVEIDVHVCKTGEIVVIHDSTINRTTKGQGKVRELTLSELQLVTVRGGHNIATLEEVLIFCENKCTIHIELKGKGTAVKVANIVTKYVKQTKWTYKSLLVSSFKRSKLNKVKQINPSINTGIIVSKKAFKALIQAVDDKCSAIYIALNKVKTSIVAYASSKNIQVYVWTVNKPKNITKMKSLSVNGIISDFPDLL